MPKKKEEPTIVKLNVDINCTVEMPMSEWDGVVSEADEGEPMAMEDHLQWNLDLSYMFGNAWITSVDKVEEIERV